MKSIIGKIEKWYWNNFMYFHLFPILLLISYLIIFFFVKITDNFFFISGIVLLLIDILSWSISVYFSASFTIVTVIPHRIPNYKLFPINSIKEFDSIQQRLLKLSKFNNFLIKILKLTIIGTLFLIVFFSNFFKQPLQKENFWVQVGIVSLGYVHIDYLFSLILVVGKTLEKKLNILNPLSSHQSEEESRYEELRTRFTSHNLINDVSNLKVYISILKKEEPQLLSKFLILEELTAMIEDTITKFRNSDSIRTKNPFILHELFDNFLILNEPDLVREESNLEIIYQNPDYKNLEIYQIFYEVYQVLNNLISNARKAIAKTEHKEIQIFTLIETAGLVIFQVSDTGVGIDSKSRNRIFDIGYSTTNGDGLGLLFVQTTLKRFGGEITLLSNAMSGFSTTFEVKIPIQKTT